LICAVWRVPEPLECDTQAGIPVLVTALVTVIPYGTLQEQIHAPDAGMTWTTLCPTLYRLWASGGASIGPDEPNATTGLPSRFPIPIARAPAYWLQTI
jgi:hypothetical protein